MAYGFKPHFLKVTQGFQTPCPTCFQQDLAFLRNVNLNFPLFLQFWGEAVVGFLSSLAFITQGFIFFLYFESLTGLVSETKNPGHAVRQAEIQYVECAGLCSFFLLRRVVPCASCISTS